eukprot:scaffold30730_cov31-Tisochrysis_lutea.AAC.6
MNITMPNGDSDPWHALGIVLSSDPFYRAGGGQQLVGPGVTIVEMRGSAHCRDMYAPSAFEGLKQPLKDTRAVMLAHEAIGKSVAGYVGHSA